MSDEPITAVLTRWALAVPLPRSAWTEADGRRIGRHAVRLVLVALAQHADYDMVAWPSRATLAAELGDHAARDVQNALPVLERAGVVKPAETPRRGRSTRWALLCDLTGHPVNQPDEHVDVQPDVTPRQAAPVNVTGDLTGDLTGELTGHPVANQNQEPEPPPPAPSGDQLAEVRAQTRQELVGAIYEHAPSKLTAGLTAGQLDALAEQLRETSWKPETLATGLGAVNFTGARKPNYLTAVLNRLAKEGPPRHVPISTATSTRWECPEHGPTFGNCRGCGSDHHDKEAGHREHPRPHCHRCTERRHAA